jgi:hypothetical protein
MDTSFAVMAAAVLEMARNEAQLIERLASEGAARGRSSIDERCLDRLAFTTDAAILLGDLVPHERLVRELVRVGALVDFPTFSANTTDLRPGSIVLLRAKLEDIHSNECRVRLEVPGVAHSVPVLHDDIVGVQKR